MTTPELQQLHTYYTVVARVHYRRYRAYRNENKPLSARSSKVKFYEAMNDRRRTTLKGA